MLRTYTSLILTSCVISVYPVVSMTGHEFRPTSSVNRILYSSEGVLLSFEAASSGSLINHDFLDVTMTTIKVEIAGGSEYAFFVLLRRN